jgi:hypothetical protein
MRGKSRGMNARCKRILATSRAHVVEGAGKNVAQVCNLCSTKRKADEGCKSTVTPHGAAFRRLMDEPLA